MVDDGAFSNGQLVRITGEITCDEGRRFRIHVEASQGDTVGQGVDTGSCTGERQGFRVVVSVVSGAGFESGPAQVEATAQVGNRTMRTIEHTFATGEEVQVTVLQSFSA